MANKILAGIDEVGRGCLAGPVISCALILKKNILGTFFHEHMCHYSVNSLNMFFNKFNLRN